MGPKLVAILVASFLLVGGASQAFASKVPVPSIPLVEDKLALSADEDEAFEALAKFDAGSALTSPKSFESADLPKAGETTSYGVKVTPDLAEAFDAFMRGDGMAALAALDRAQADAGSNARASFQVSSLRAQVFIMMGRPDAAEEELRRTEAMEIEAFGTNVNSRALRGEARLWASDYDGAISDLARVAVATREWRLPTSYTSPPSNLGELFNLTTAQLRAYITLAAAYLQQGNYESALSWAERAEAGYADVISVVTSPTYGPYVPYHADGYYGRALNLAVLGATRLIVKHDREAAEKFFRSAHAALDAINFTTPKITVDALYAQALYTAGFDEEAAAAATRTAEEAAKLGLPDLVWRIEALRGEALFADGRSDEAEAAFRRAQAAIESVSGALATDRAKRRFGIGKDSVTYRLVNFGIAKGDMGAVFRDLERGRARAFVDMLADQAVANGREAELSGEIRRIDAELRQIRLLAASPKGAPREVRESQAELVARRRELADELRTRDPELADVLSIAHYELPDIQAALGDGEVMAYGLPSRPEDAIRLLLMTRDKVEIHTLGITHRDLQGTIRKLKSAMLQDADAEAQVEIVGGLAARLGVAKWGATRALYIVPTGQLYFVPWGALDTPAPVAVLPTGGWLKRTSKTVGGAAAVIVGDPQFFGELPQLAGARVEAERIGAHYGVQPLLGDQAREDALREGVGGGTRILHIATHAEFNARKPLQSALFLSGDQTAQSLTAAQLYEQPIPAGLVVLSACETGAGKVVAGEDFLGLTRSFYLSGATTVINSLWPVSDEGTLAFMVAFHEGLAEGDVGSAWLAARDKLRSEGFPPFVYGAFVVGGSLKL